MADSEGWTYYSSDGFVYFTCPDDSGGYLIPEDAHEAVTEMIAKLRATEAPKLTVAEFKTYLLDSARAARKELKDG